MYAAYGFPRFAREKSIGGISRSDAADGSRCEDLRFFIPRS
jgi:hypothetical protein